MKEKFIFIHQKIDYFVFWVCVVAAIILFFANDSRAAGYDQQVPFPSCTKDRVEISRLTHKMTITIFKTLDKAGLYSGTDYDGERLWAMASKQASKIVNDNYVCKT